MTANDEAMLDTSNLGIAKGREGGYAIVAPYIDDATILAKYEDMTKTLAELVGDASLSAKSLGFISEDGVTFTTDTDSDDVTDWGGDVIASPLSSYGESASATFLESRKSVLSTVYGDDNVSEKDGVTMVRHNARFTTPHLFIFDSVISDTIVKRTIIPCGSIVERDDVEQNNSDLIGYTPTIKCLPSNAYDGDVYRDFFYDVATAANTTSTTSTKSTTA